MKVKTTDYFGVMRYYAFMPQKMFDALCCAYVNNQVYACIDARDYAQMQERWQRFMYAGRTK